MLKQISSPAPARSNSGFTLLELLLAFVVFALSFATVLEILSGSMRNTVRARHYSEAALTAQSLMDQVGLEIPLEAGSRGEQLRNSEVFVQKGCSLMLKGEIASETFLDTIADIVDNETKLKEMRNAAYETGKGDSAVLISRMIEEVSK